LTFIGDIYMGKINQNGREQRNNHRGWPIWLTDLSGSSKFTIASQSHNPPNNEQKHKISQALMARL
jgi:adenylylsulfate kinase-like enzyme